MKEQHQSFDICVVCALYEEAYAVLDEFSTCCGVPFIEAFHSLNQLEYRHATIQNQRGEFLTIFVTWLSHTGPTRIGLDLVPLLREIRPRFIAMTGVCAGDQRKAKLGDLIVATEAYYLEEGKITTGSDGQSIHAPETRTVGTTPRVAQYVQGFDGWKDPVREMKRQQLKRVWKSADEPQCYVGVMASSMAVHADNPFPEWASQHNRKTLGIDMEAATFYTALRNFPLMHGLVVKGVSDYGDSSKTDRYRDYAAHASAAYLLHFIQKYVTQETMPPSAHAFSPPETAGTNNNFDSAPCQEVSRDALNEECVKRFLTQKKVQQLRDDNSNLDAFGWPRQVAFLQESPPTYATLLCFGKNPSRVVPGASTRCTSWRGETRVEGWREDLKYKGSLLEQYEEGCSFLKRSLRLQRVIDDNGSREEWEIPLRVLEEAVANALIHREYANVGRDYHPSNNPVYIEIYDDRVEISNPGEPLLPIAQLGVTHESHPRNSLIMDIFYFNGNVEQIGSGIERMQVLLQKAQLPPPEFQLSPSKLFKVIIRRPPDPQEAELKETQAELKETQAELKETQANLQRQRASTRLTRVLLGLMALLVLIGLLGSGGWWYYSYSHPDPTRVTTLNDNGSGSLRQAIGEAKAGSTITFDAGLQGTIYLTSGDLDLSKNMILQDSNLGNISISSGLRGYTISIDPVATVTFENLTFTSSTIRSGAFIRNQGHLTLNNCIVSHNISYDRGGGLANLGGSLTLNSAVVSDNAAGDEGGGIYNWNGPLTLSNSVVSRNRATYNGGGIFSLLGSVTIINSTVGNNETTSQKSSNSAGGGIALVNSLLTLSTSGIGPTRSTIQNNSTQGSGGGIALLGSLATITNSTITGNRAGLSGGGIAVEKDTENDKVGFGILTDLEITNVPQTAPFLGKNIAPHNPDILGILRTDSSRPLIISVSSGITGSPAPSSFPPEQSPQYRGAVDLNTFCQSEGYREFQSHAPYDPYTLSCIAPARSAMFFTPLQACEWKAQTTDVLARLADYYDPSSWQCYVHEKELGNIATPENMNNFCKLLGNKGVMQIGTTAYDWQCVPSSGIPVGLSMANACQWFYHRQDAFDRLVAFNKLSGWECWAPK